MNARQWAVLFYTKMPKPNLIPLSTMGKAVQRATSQAARPTSALIKLGDYTFEMDDQQNIRPYADKPTLEHQTMAESLRDMVKEGIGHSSTYQPISGSRNFHGVFTVDPQKWLGQMLETHQPDFTPDDMQPHPTMPGAWIFRNPNDGSYQIYK